MCKYIKLSLLLLLFYNYTIVRSSNKIENLKISNQYQFYDTNNNYLGSLSKKVVYDLSTEKGISKKILGDPRLIKCLSISNDGTFIVVGYSNGDVKLSFNLDNLSDK